MMRRLDHFAVALSLRGPRGALRETPESAYNMPLGLTRCLGGVPSFLRLVMSRQRGRKEMLLRPPASERPPLSDSDEACLDQGAAFG